MANRDKPAPARESDPTSRSTANRRRRQQRPVDGILLLDKPSGSTSNRVLQRVKRMYQARKAGHTGSLDPLASGMLPLCFGQATKVSAYLLDADKEYLVTARFGVRTDTADAEGRPVEQSPIDTVARDDLLAVLERFRGEIEQVPPMYSALKKDGVRLYELARRGKEVPRVPRRVRIHELEVESYEPATPTLRVRCSKGTYIRTLVEDVAAAAGTVGHVLALRRRWVAPFQECELVNMEQLESAAGQGLAALDRFLVAPDKALGQWPAVALSQQQAQDLCLGRPAADVGERSAPGRVRVYDNRNRFLGIGELLPDGRLAPKRLFVENLDFGAD